MAKYVYLKKSLTAQDVKRIVTEHPRYNPAGYESAWRFLDKAYRRSVKSNLRMDRKTWTLRSTNVVWSEPVILSDWPECTYEDALCELARHVWCDCCMYHNRELMGIKQ